MWAPDKEVGDNNDKEEEDKDNKEKDKGLLTI